MEVPIIQDRARIACQRQGRSDQCVFYSRDLTETLRREQEEIGWYRIISDYDAGIAVRTGPSAKEELLGRIPQGTPFYVDATCDVWGHTTVNGYTGWVHLDYAEEI